MNVVGKFGSLIAQGVYSVATPIHPFGGAVDIIVVQQPDGSFRSTPWYVRFGKFQGVLKGAEKIVRIEVNGVEASFHMHLDNSGEAYFIRELVSNKENEGNDGLKDSDSVRDDCSSIDYNDTEDGRKESVNQYTHEDSVSGSVEVLQDEHISLGVDRIDRTESDSERAFYEFQDDQSSLADSLEFSEYGSSRYENLDSVDSLVETQNANSEVVLVSVDGHILTAPISSSERNTENMQLSIPQFHLGPVDGSEFSEGNAEFSTSDNWAADYFGDLDKSGHKVSESNCKVSTDTNADAVECNLGIREGDKEEDVAEGLETRSIANEESELGVPRDSENVSSSVKRDDIFKSCLELHDLGLQVENANEQEQESSFEIQGDDEDPPEKSSQNVLAGGESEDSDAGILISNDETSPLDSDASRSLASPLQVETEPIDRDSSSSVQTFSESIPVYSISNDQEPEQCNGSPDIQTNTQEEIQSNTQEPSTEWSKSQMVGSQKSSFSKETKDSKFEISLCRNLLSGGMGLSAAAEAFNAHRISEEEFRLSAASLVKNENLVVRFQDMYLPWDKAAPIVLGMAVYGLVLPLDHGDAIPVEEGEAPKPREDESRLVSTPSGRRWRLWSIPFRRVKTIEHTVSDSSEEVFVDTESGSNHTVEPTPASRGENESPHKQLFRTNVPTSEEIASLHLKEGQNMVNFIFSAGVLGKPNEVQAHIYLWKWNTRIVISDVDGTITKSDVLGQFMPLVGRDWTQSGVARLFSAIKENGYQLLFLSARAIVQAYLTRRFLVNLKQDGKALPHGPVVISPDGLFPSLYREVIRRAPHEFKIACLQDIKALFPADYNPFYAGFGNRDTDELSYRKIGIPKGKIFIINPKGEVAISHRIDVKSYTSLHTLVNDMFPPTSMVEQEDYNSWNYWRMPLPDIEDL